MIVSTITLDQHADIYATLTNRQQHDTGSETLFTGNHPELGTVILFQNGANDTGTLIQLGQG
ncbi:MAG: hypothetical protein M8364_12010 [Methylobacter sp.]|uniref:hypothetical protein n=1 Tax=unclassified Methylobacter TaxID=2635283 RepID=UPI00055EF8B3|nr:MULTISPECIES: hypothetical protein [unclassified Methylobacter]MCL7421617.1 hypothetical protein [Methylobacter sp.]